MGLKLSLFLAFILFTGTLAVLSAEIDWVLHPTLRVAPSTVDQPSRWDLIAQNAARHPGVVTIDYIARPTAGAFAARVAFQRADKSRGYLHVHPVTGRVQGEQGFVDAQRILRNLHRHLNLPVKYGVPIVGSLSILLLISVGTSFVVYRKWWRGFFKPIRWRDVRTAWGDFHRLAGVWSLWFVTLIALTGLWYLVEQLGGDAPDLPEPAAIAALPSANATVAAADSLAASLVTAQRVDPDLRIEMIQFPDKKSGAFIFQGQRSAWLVRPRANALWIDAATAGVVLGSDGRDLNVHQRISEMADPLHFGTFAGYWTRIPWFLFGLLMTGLTLSGAAIYSHRIAHSARTAIVERPIWNGMWRGMRRWRWLSVALIVTGTVMTAWMF